MNKSTTDRTVQRSPGTAPTGAKTQPRAPGKQIRTAGIQRSGAAGPMQAKAASAAPSAPSADTSAWFDVAMRPDLHQAPMQRKQGSASGDAATESGQSTGPGARMPADVQAKMENSFAADFSSVRVHQGPEAQSMGALAYTQGADVHFAPGQYAPHSESGQALLGHELTHVVQQSQGRVSAPTQGKDAPINSDTGLEHEADVLGGRAARGEIVSHALGTGPAGAGGSSNAVQRAPDPAAASAAPAGPAAVTPAPENGAGTEGGDEVAAGEGAAGTRSLCNNYGNWVIYPDDFADSLPASTAEEFHVKEADFAAVTQELDTFHSQCFGATNFHPSTGPGVFDVGLTPQPGGPNTLTISVRVAFNFVSAKTPADYPGAAPEDLAWQEGESAQYATDCLAAINGTWSGAMQFKGTAEFWDNVLINVAVSVWQSDDEPHYTLTVQKIPPGEWAGSDANAAGTGSNHGTANFDSEDVNHARKAGGQQRAAVHEFGHMIGLGDEYAGKPTPRHSASFEAVTGNTIATGSDDRIMSGGETILAEHYITFLEGLKEATAMDEWNYATT